MTYRSLLVLLDQDPLCAARTQVAMRLAKDLDCHLVGVAPTGIVGLLVSPEGATSLAEYATLSWDALRDQAEQATQRFRDACRAIGLKSFEAVIDESDKADPSAPFHLPAAGWKERGRSERSMQPSGSA